MGKADTVRLKSYRGPWKGQLLLACGKCQKKLRDDDEDKHGLGKLKKALKQRAKLDPDPLRLVVIRTQCLKMCPKRGITVCTQAQMATGRTCVVRTSADIDALYAECKADEAFVPVEPGSLANGERRKRRQTR